MPFSPFPVFDSFAPIKNVLLNSSFQIGIIEFILKWPNCQYLAAEIYFGAIQPIFI